MIIRLLVLSIGFSLSALQAQPLPCDVQDKYNLASGDDPYVHFLRALPADISLSRPRTTVTIPVVVHVVAPSGSAPVTRAQVLHQLDVLNRDMQGLGENTSKVPDMFRSLIGSVDFQFCLADTDPGGMPTSGMTLTTTDLRDIGQVYGQEGRRVLHYDQLGGKSGWDPSLYVNIWVAENGDFLGSATFPGMAPFPEETGVVIHLDNFGSVGEAGASGFFGRGHTLTHEMGHYFGLKHIWGDGLSVSCADSDDMEDTPNQAGPHYGCPSGEVVSCGSADMVHNFMDFSDDRCLAFFTPDQVARMQAVKAVFYPELGEGGTCRELASDVDAWWDELTWAFDALSGRYIVFHPRWDLMGKRVEVFSMDGRLVFADEWGRQNTHLLDLGRSGAGVYAVRITAGHRRFVRKLVQY